MKCWILRAQQRAISSKSSTLPNRPKFIETVLLGGGIAGILDGLDAVIFYYLAFAVTPALLFQHIASGILGRQSFRGGSLTVILGVALHFSIAAGAAAVYWLASSRFVALLRRPFVYGPVFGFIVYLVMHYVVVPLSAITPRTIPVTRLELVDQLFSHTIFVGLPIALIAHRSAQRESTRKT